MMFLSILPFVGDFAIAIFFIYFILFTCVMAPLLQDYNFLNRG